MKKSKKREKEVKEEVVETKSVEKSDNIDSIIKELQKDGHVIKRASDIGSTEIIRTGIFGLDYILSGGIHITPGSTRIEMWGGESSFKTTFSLIIAKKFQELGKTVAFIDAENSYDLTYGKILGLDNDKLIISYPETLEEYGDLIIKLIPKTDLIITDSIVSLIPIGEAERDTESPQMALQARVNALITRKIYNAIKDNKTVMIFINQLRQKLGVMYGSPNTSAGGNAFRHFYSTRIEFKTGQAIKENDEKVGVEVKINCIKNKRGVPGRTAEIDFYLNGEYDNKKCLFFAGIKYLTIERSGNTYTFKDVKVTGQDNFIKAMTDENWKDLEENIWGILN
jgi:recombination protein RecA